jgi:hypothetical protein
MLTRRTFHIVVFSLGTITTFSWGAGGQQNGMVTVRIRADDSVRAVIPPIAQRDLTIEPDQSETAQDLARRSPPERAVPIIFIIIGAMALTELAEMINEMLRQVYYGGVVIDMRTQPPGVTSDPKVPANMVFVIDAEGKTTRYTSDRFSFDVLKSALEVK